MESGADGRREAGGGVAAPVGAPSSTTSKDESESEPEGQPPQLGELSATASTEGHATGNPDVLARLRKEKRLAMNRESARNRRKRKKMLIESLEAQVTALKNSNQQYQLTNEALSARVRALESDLAVARTTIRQLTGAFPHSVLPHTQPQLKPPPPQQQQQQQLGTAAASLAGSAPEFRALEAQAPRETNDLDRLRQAQLQQLALIQGAGGGGGAAGSVPWVASGVGGYMGAADEASILRRRQQQQQQLLAAQAANRERALIFNSNAGIMSSPSTNPDSLLNTVSYWKNFCADIPVTSPHANLPTCEPRKCRYSSLTYSCSLLFFRTARGSIPARPWIGRQSPRGEQ